MTFEVTTTLRRRFTLSQAELRKNQEEACRAIEEIEEPEVPELELPEPEIDEEAPEPIFTTDDTWIERTKKLIARRKYVD